MIALCALWNLDLALREYKPVKLISLLDPPCALDTPTCIEVGFHLKLPMHDIVLPIPFATRPDQGHIERLLEFGRAWSPPERLLVHCAVGISRSSAALILLLAQKNNGRESEVVRLVRERAHHIRPNARIIKLGDEALGCEGRLIEAVADMRGPSLRDPGERFFEFPASVP
jgi:predicted protein tyrosine phosphatase